MFKKLPKTKYNFLTMLKLGFTIEAAAKICSYKEEEIENLKEKYKEEIELIQITSQTENQSLDKEVIVNISSE